MNLFDSIPYSSFLKNIDAGEDYSLIMGYNGFTQNTIMISHGLKKEKISPIYLGYYHIQLVENIHHRVVDKCIIKVNQSNKYAFPYLKFGASKEEIIKYEKQRDSEVEIKDSTIVAKIKNSDITISYHYADRIYVADVYLPQFCNGYCGNTLMQGIPIQFENREEKYGLFCLVYDNLDPEDYINNHDIIMQWDNEFFPLDKLGHNWLNMAILSNSGTRLFFLPIMFFPEFNREYAVYNHAIFNIDELQFISYSSLDSLPFKLIWTETNQSQDASILKEKLLIEIPNNYSLKDIKRLGDSHYSYHNRRMIARGVDSICAIDIDYKIKGQKDNYAHSTRSPSFNTDYFIEKPKPIEKAPKYKIFSSDYSSASYSDGRNVGKRTYVVEIPTEYTKFQLDQIANDICSSDPSKIIIIEYYLKGQDKSGINYGISKRTPTEYYSEINTSYLYMKEYQ